MDINSFLRNLPCAMFRSLKKYMFALTVFAYLTSVIGLPVYLHYCGGELEEISYLVKSNSCCGDEEPVDNGCCSDEGLVVKYNPDATFKFISVVKSISSVQQLFVIPFLAIFFPNNTAAYNLLALNKTLPPKIQSSTALSVTILRI